LNSGLDPCKAGAVPLELQLQSILLWLFWMWTVAQTICLGWPRTTILPISASQVTKITDLSHPPRLLDALIPTTLLEPFGRNAFSSSRTEPLLPLVHRALPRGSHLAPAHSALSAPPQGPPDPAHRLRASRRAAMRRRRAWIRSSGLSECMEGPRGVNCSSSFWGPMDPAGFMAVASTPRELCLNRRRC
jgi:hypothetical protein